MQESGGERGIRTLGTGASPYNGLATVWLSSLPVSLVAHSEDELKTKEEPPASHAIGSGIAGKSSAAVVVEVFWKLPRDMSFRTGSGTPRNYIFITSKACAWNCAISFSVSLTFLKTAR
jgi:hypothetical protein